MKIFSSDSKGVVAWGPVASVTVKAGSLNEAATGSNGWVLTNFSIGAKEITDIRQCFDDVSYIYALGNNQGQCSMTLVFAIFLGKEDCSGPNNTGTIGVGLNEYKVNRISTKRGMSPSPVTIGNFSRMGWLTGIEIGQLDAARGLCYGTVHFIMELDK